MDKNITWRGEALKNMDREQLLKVIEYLAAAYKIERAEWYASRRIKDI